MAYAKTKCVVADCDAMLKRQHFLDQSREDTLFLLDIEKRKEVLSVYNKVQSDFESQEEYDAYLVKIEETIDTLIHGSTQE
jgi:hypothetical protein